MHISSLVAFHMAEQGLKMIPFRSKSLALFSATPVPRVQMARRSWTTEFLTYDRIHIAKPLVGN